ncbi:MAG: hypothetical protein V1672_00070 [Candidatus Diapherotrites archaeon]
MAIKQRNMLSEARNAFSKSDVFKLRELSNEAVRNASLNNDKFMAEIAILAYALHKLSSKEHITKSRQWETIKKNILRSMSKTISLMESENLKEFKQSLKEVVESVSDADTHLGYFSQTLYSKARIKVASTAYSLGMSLSQAVDLTDADKSRLLSYIGGTRISDEEVVHLGIAERLEKLKKELSDKK